MISSGSIDFRPLYRSARCSCSRSNCSVIGYRRHDVGGAQQQGSLSPPCIAGSWANHVARCPLSFSPPEGLT